MQLLNFVYFGILVLVTLSFLFKKERIVSYPLDKTRKMIFSGSEMALLLMFSTGTLSFNTGYIGGMDLSAIRLLSVEIFCVIGIFVSKNRSVSSFAAIFSLLYLGWLTWGLFYTPSFMYGLRTILKYMAPILMYFFAASAVRKAPSFFKIMLTARKVSFVLIGIALFFPFLTRLFPGVLAYGTALVVHCIVMSFFSLALYFRCGKEWKDLLFAFFFTLPCILLVFRSSIMGTAAGLAMFFFVIYRIKSLPVLAGVVLLFILSVFYVPQVKEKMFTSDKVSVEDLQSGKVSMDNINSNGRFAMWEKIMKRLYDGKELSGSGTGATQNLMYTQSATLFAGLMATHSDYVQILSDNGLIGLFLYIGALLMALIHCVWVYSRENYSCAIRVAAIVAASALLGMYVTSITENSVNYSIATFLYPWGIYGMMTGMIKGEKY